jgi:hypothetical protein
MRTLKSERSRQGLRASLLSLAAAAVAFAGTGADAKSCAVGRVLVYQQESAGLPNEDWRDFYVFGLLPDGQYVLHFDPASNSGTWLEDVSGGTNVPTRGLIPANGSDDTSGAEQYRFLEARRESGGGVTQALIVDMAVYWPTCVLQETVHKWKSMAGQPRP